MWKYDLERLATWPSLNNDLMIQHFCDVIMEMCQYGFNDKTSSDTIQKSLINYRNSFSSTTSIQMVIVRVEPHSFTIQFLIKSITIATVDFYNNHRGTKDQLTLSDIRF